MNAYQTIPNFTDTTLTYNAIPDYGEHVKYDPNGNILNYFRNGTTANGGPLGMDSLTYKYQHGNNKLDHVNDAVAATNYSVDIDNEDTLNYRYDQIGNLNDVNQPWRLYPLDQQQASCYSSKQQVIDVFDQYYFNDMANSKMYSINQGGVKKGVLELQPYGYNLQNVDFWTKCWLWQKDTVGAAGLYPFQVKSYGYGGVNICDKCADSVKLPEIIYPFYLSILYK